MSRFDGKLSAGGEAPFDLAELLAALGSQPEASAESWRDAIACYLSASDGWRDASQLLGGAFASDPAEPDSGTDKEPHREINQRISEYLQRAALKRNRIDND